MATATSPGPSPDEDVDLEDGADSSGMGLASGQDFSGHGSKAASPAEDTPTSDANAKMHMPIQKRRRVTRACDECRRKKIKCDGKQPCTHCTVYSYDCTYDQPSNRRRNPAPQYIEALEQRLQKAEAILRTVLPGIDLDDPKYDARGIEQIIESAKSATNVKKPPPAPKAEDEGEMQSMVDRTGSLDLDDQGNWDFHGHSSGYAFMRRFRAQFGEQFLPDPRVSVKNRSISQVIDSPKSGHSSLYDFGIVSGVDLPPREVAIELCRNTIDDACALMRPLHRPHFFRRLHSLYDTEPEQYTNEHMRFIPLVYVVMAVGCLFSRTEHENSMLDLKGYKEAIEQGYQYFNTAKQMLDITDCRDLITIQAIFFMIMFLQSSAKLSTCYAYIGIALRACCRLGLHRDLSSNFNPIEKEERKRMFWLIRKIDSYVGAITGLPRMLSEEDIDQELPSEVHDDYITEKGILPMPPETFPLLKASNAHTRLTCILQKVVRHIYPIKGSGNIHDKNSISHGRIRELERDLQIWMDELPAELRPSDNAATELSRVQQLLRISYAHVQMMMYRPFIHYVSQASQAGKADKRSFACAAACVSVARNIVHITSEMKRRGLLVGSYWFVMYTTYFAILSLVYFVLENPASPTGKDILKDALEGRDTLAGLAQRSMAADRCTISLAGLFNKLPDKLQERRTSLQTTPTTSRKRPQPNPEPGQLVDDQSASGVVLPNNLNTTTNRARTLPRDYLAKIAKRNSMPDPASVYPFSEQKVQDPHTMGMHSPVVASPLTGHFDFTAQMDSARIPDLKNVMFPSDNPFAYPNQPISTLESADPQYGFPEPGPESFSASNDNSMFGTPNSINNQGQPQANQGQEFDVPNFQTSYNENPNLVQQFARQGRHFGTSLPGLGMQGLSGSSHMFEIPTMQESGRFGGASGQGPPDDYWSQMSKGTFGNGTEFTGGSAVNLDDLFGGDGWSGIWNDQAFSRP